MENSGLYVCRAENEANFVFSQWVEVKVTSPIPKKGIVIIIMTVLCHKLYCSS